MLVSWKYGVPQTITTCVTHLIYLIYGMLWDLEVASHLVFLVLYPRRVLPSCANKRKCLFVSNRSVGTPNHQGKGIVTQLWWGLNGLVRCLIVWLWRSCNIYHCSWRKKQKVESLPWAHCLPFAKVCHELCKCVWMLGWCICQVS